MKEFAKGVKIGLALGGEVTIIDTLGSGGQGTVYKVALDGQEYALKWYHNGGVNSPVDFKRNLAANIAKGTPGKSFLWPLYLTEQYQGSFGYVMDLRPKEFSDFADILNTKDKHGNKVVFSVLHNMINASINIVNCFRGLHRNGLSYQDLNDGNFFINVNNGDVLICDNDNVAPDGENSGIGGKPGYMAPEVVTGKEKPDALTDAHSLAVILFKLLIRHDPLMGTNFVNSVCITEDKELELYGTNPIFIFDPNNSLNRPAAGIHNNPIRLWPVYPKYIQDAFIKSFCEGMKDPSKRLTENEWQKLLVKLRDDIIICPICGSESFINNIKFDASGIAVCANQKCGIKFSKPMKLRLKDYEINMFPKNKLYKCHTDGNSDDYEIETGEVIQNKNNPNLWGIQNKSKDQTWLMKAPDGRTENIPPSSVIPIMDGMEITFLNATGTIQKI